MSKNVIQKVIFRTKPEELYNLYMNSRKHAAAIGSRASVVPRVGGHFSAFGMLTGKFLILVKNQMIVQTWRAKPWKKADLDSFLILVFKKVKGGTQLNLAHINVPDYDYRDIQIGWHSYYWRPWREYLSKKQKIKQF